MGDEGQTKLNDAKQRASYRWMDPMDSGREAANSTRLHSHGRRSSVITQGAYCYITLRVRHYSRH